MSVNIFGSSGRQSSKIDNTYVDRKFIILTTNLTSKMDKSGGNFTGDIHMADKNITISHTPMSANDVINKKYFDELIARRLNDDDMKIIENRLSLKLNLAGDEMRGAIRMGDHKITSNRVPEEDDELVNIRYLNTRFVKNNSGYIPELNRNNSNDSGFTLTSSEEISGYPAYFAFTSWKNHWLPSNRTGGWLQIECPNSVRINSFSLLARKEDSVEWVQLFTTRDEQPLDNEVSFFHVNNTLTFKFFKLQIKGSIGDTPGVSFFQLFTLDSIA